MTRPGGRPLTGSAGTTVRQGFAYGPDGLLSAATDSVIGTRTVALDDIGRITAVAAAGWQERYAYDAAGNLTSAAWPAEDVHTTPASP